MGVVGTRALLGLLPPPSRCIQQHMASLQARRSRGHTYWHIVESRRVNGKPRPVPVYYLGKADDLLARLQGEEALRIRSAAHGAVAALWAQARELGIAEVIDAQLLITGRRAAGDDLAAARPLEPPVKNDGLTVGESLTLASLGRACHATSKRGFAEWASSTSLGSLAEVDVDRLTSQHFWDQMDQVPLEAIDRIERELVGQVLERFDVPLDTVLFDATNFFTFIASTNKRPTLPARGHNKQKRDDLRQVGVALLCSHIGGIPLWHQTYGGRQVDAKSFADAVPAVRRRLVELHRDITSMTIVFDKGNVSRANQKLVDGSGIHYVTGLTVASQKELVQKANPLLAPVELAGGEQVLAFRERRMIWGVERTAVVMLSERLREGQARGVLQHVASAQSWLGELAQTLRRGKQKRDRGRILRDIEKRLHGRQRLGDVLTYELKGNGSNLALCFGFDEAAFETLKRDALGRIVLVTDHDDWSTAEIIDAYHGQSKVEAVFAHLKDPMHIALRPQFHWTDQKLHVHVLTCILGYLLAQCVFLKAQKAGAPYKSSEALLDALNKVRRAAVARSVKPRGGVRLSTQLEEIDPKLGPYLPALGVGA
ncbi:MAG: IS1634 family transposase [Planctomycetes bacterium]|nr:IS1634 family transposase [Planctomycetota bacterium]